MTGLHAKKFLKAARWILLLYALTGIAVYHFQDRIFFRPVAVSLDHRYEFGIPYRERNIRFRDNANLNLVEFPVAGRNRRGIVLYLHGNRTNIGWYVEHVAGFHRNGYEVWMIDYPGYGKSTGPMESEMLFAYALQMYKLARTQVSSDSIVIYGKSLGTGIAAWLASRQPSARLILETPYYSLSSLAASRLPIFPWERMLRIRLDTWEYLSSVTVPVMIFHGTDDGMIPYRNAVRLKSLLKAGDGFVTVPGGSHRDLGRFPSYRKVVDSLLSGVRQ
jgi:pimeloyl-ACP methyl ester carboxylesterase